MRTLKGATRTFLYWYIVAMGLFHIYTALFGNYEAYLQRVIHLTWVLPMAFVLFPLRSSDPCDRVPWYDWVLAALSTVPGIYAMFNYTEIASRIVQVDPVTLTQLLLGSSLLVLLLDATRRVVGWPLALIAGIFAAYMYWGHYMPGLLRGLSFSLPEVIEHVYLTDEGIFSMPLGVSAAYVMVFLIFGGFLEKSGAGMFFMDVAQAFTGTAAGGPAKIAVVSSCLFGSISGSAVANVYGTGSFTIPLMKKIGYPAYFAGAVEAVASSGGQIMPPVMGAGAFIMASFLGIPYKDIMIAALFPAFLYYAAVLVMVHVGARKSGLRGLSPEELPDKRTVLRRAYLLLPVIGLVYLLLSGYTPMYAAVVGILLAWIVSLVHPGHRMGPKEIIDAIHLGAKNIPIVCIACACAGIVVGAVSLTGFGFKFVGFVFSFARDIPLLALCLIMLVSLILGMGLPTTGAYILAAALGVPVLVKLGFSALAAHMFVFYFAIISNITPPVALAAYAASSIAGSDPNKTGFMAMKLGFLAFIVPFAFCYDSGILLNASLWVNLAAIAGSLAAIFAFAYSMMGYIRAPLPMWSRGAFFIAGLLCFTPNLWLKGLGIVGTVVAWMLFRNDVLNSQAGLGKQK